VHRARSLASTFAFWGLVAAAAGFLAWDVSAALFPAVEHRTGGIPLTVAAVDPGEEAGPEDLPAVRPRFTDGRLPTRLVIPSVGIDTQVEEVGIVRLGGEPQWETSWRAAGHLITSALPGQPGNVVFAGHVSVADPRNVAVFAELDRVQPGDVVEVHAGAAVYRYRVTEMLVVKPNEIWVLRSQPTPTITLITCTKDLRARLVVRGELES
jgi:sortase A